ncbi:MAG: PAS domain-containing sensor histidine kinase [Patescibacteria group bacterium]|jgi:PAS domain S-box-containing protein|nr:PAS domain-containing sensor histidine kinase [Patescibacteria group bacterium]
MVDTNNDKYIQANLEHERLTALINSMADAVIAVDENQKVVIYNGAALNLLDINKSLVGYEIRHLIKIIDKNGHQADIESIIRKTTTQFTTRDLKLQYPDGEQINLYLSIAPVHLGYGNRGKKGHVILARDITREKSLEEERDEFISVISHELRTPIAIAEGNLSNAQFVLDRTANAPESIRQSLKSSYDQIQFLSGMINDLATLSRAERGKLSAEIESINAHELLKDFESSYTKSAQEKGLKLIIKPDPNLEVLKSSKLYVKEILQNFITNAIKYTQEGSVTIKAHHKENGVEFEISDTGIGISKSDQSRVFDKFFRSEDYRTKQSSGTGLGLYVTVKLAKMIKADINLKSELNNGSTFSVFFPNLD